MEKENIFSFNNPEDESHIADDTLNKNIITEKNMDLDINVLRERTFNKELSDLVSRIQENESKIDTLFDINQTTDDELLRMFHQLYYKSINLTDTHTINSDLNPFDLFKEASTDDLFNLIYYEMNKIGFNQFAILAYNFEQKCYTAHCNYINNLNENNIVLTTSENLYIRVINKKDGLIININEINNNLYFKKRFSQGKDLLFISLISFFKDFYSDADLDNVNDFSDHLLPILIIQLTESIKENQIKPIYDLIKNKLTVYFFLLHKKIQIDLQNSNFNNLQGIYNFLDFTYQNYNKNKDCVCMIVKCKKYLNIEILFILKYLQNKLTNKLPDNTTTSRIEKDRLLIFTQKTKRKVLDEILEDFNKLFNYMFQIEIFITEETSNNFFFLQNIKEYLAK